MKRFDILTIAFLLMLISGIGKAQAPVVTFMQLDTFAINGMKNQPVLKIKIHTSVNTNTLEQIRIKSLCEDSTDIDNVVVYLSRLNRFSLEDYQDIGTTIITSRKNFTGDSVVFGNMTTPLSLGDSYIWILLDLASTSIAGHNIGAAILKGGVKISGVTYPSSDFIPTKPVSIRKKYYSENFEHYNNAINRYPLNWTQQHLGTANNADWQCYQGGYGSNPGTAKSGSYNARLIFLNSLAKTTILQSPPLNFNLVIQPRLTFYHAQMQFCKSTCGPTDYNDTDSLGVYYKIGAAGSWKFLKDYVLPTPTGQWVKRVVELPSEIRNSEVYFGFKGTAQWGFGTCVDSIVIYEAGVLPREINAIVTDNPYKENAPQSATKVPVSRTNIKVRGNTNSILLKSFKVTSANTSDADIAPNGVKLWTSPDSLFVAPKLIGAGQSFTSGAVTFTLNRKLETGENYIWVTYDIADNAVPDHVINAKIMSGSIVLDTIGLFPGTNQQPLISRVIKQSIFFDNFETDKLWSLTGDFERGQPMGKGGVKNYYPDPKTAYSDNNVLGNDLSGIGVTPGDYEAPLTYANANKATTTIIDGKYFKNIELNFKRWLNVGSQDSAVLEFQYKDSTNWHEIWRNPNILVDNTWQSFYKDLKKPLDRNKFVLRFRLGPTSNNLSIHSGWNIDDLFVTGDSVKHDAAIIKYIYPKSACSLTSNEHIKVTVKNNGPRTITNIPIKFSKDGGKTWVTETISTPIDPDNTLDYQFTTPVDFSNPAIYTLIVKTQYPNDDYPVNDSVLYYLTAVPTYNLPFQTNFEKDTTFWSSGGLNSSWAHCIPTGDYIRTTTSGLYCWKTNNFGRNNINENSYVESPCFNFNTNDIPLVDVRYSFRTLPKTDGAKLSYSLDEGVTWSYVSNDTYPFPWAWYNDTIHTYHGIKGWTGQTDNGIDQYWERGIQILPAPLANKPKVKFRFEFKTDSSVFIARDGFAFDDFKLYNAPYDVGVVSIDNLSLQACEFGNPENIQVTVQNFGIRDVRLNDSIFIGIKINNNPPVIDTFKITSSAFLKNTTRQFTLTKKVNLSLAGNYTISAFTRNEKEPTFYGTNNDTTKLVMTVNPNPVTNLKDSIFTARKDTVVLQVPNLPQYSFAWKDRFSHTGTSNMFNVQSYDWQTIRVTNTTSGCFTKDSVFIKQLLPDAGVTKIFSPVNDTCSYGVNFKPVVEITNFGTDTLQANQGIPIKMKLNSLVPITDTIIVNQAFKPGDKITVTFNKPINLSLSQIDKLAIYTQLPYDVNPVNDTIINNFQVYGIPPINFGPDKSISTDTYTLDAGSDPSIISYLWNTGATSQTLFITEVGTYYATVKNAHNCINSDTISLWLKVHNLTVSSVTNPVTACSFPKDTAIRCYIKNRGTDTIYVSEPITMGYSINGAGFIHDAPFYLPTTFYPKDSILYTFTNKINISTPGIYSISIASVLGGDNRPHDDTLKYNMEVYGNPPIELGVDKTVQAVSYLIKPAVGKFSYTWQDNSTDSVFLITRSHAETNHFYKVTAQSIHGCISRDSVHIYLKLRDIKIDTLANPLSACIMPDSSVISVRIKNFGTDTIPALEPLTIAYRINGGATVQNSFTLPARLRPDDTYTYSFFKKASFNTIGAYSAKLSVVMAADLVPSNDTLSVIVANHGNPYIDLGANRAPHAYADTVRTHADRPIASYLWQDGSTDSTYIITRNHYQRTGKPNKYRVVVTDINNCKAVDSVSVVLIDEDLEITRLESPTTSCTLTNQEQMSFKVTNVGNTKLTNRAINLTYSINKTKTVTQDFLFSGDTTAAQSSKIYIFPLTEDFSANGSYKIHADLTFTGDVRRLNDTLTTLVNVYGNPTVSFNAINDSIKVDNYPYTLVPQTSPGTFNYVWSTSEVTSTIDLMKDDWYTVIISDTNLCRALKSVFVQMNLNNIGIAALYPSTSCVIPKDTTIGIRITNTGTLDLTNIPVKVQYQLDGGAVVSKDIVFTGKPKVSYLINFDQKENFSSAHSYALKTSLSWTGDQDPADDSKEIVLDLHDLPVITFAGITQDVIDVPALPFLLDAGTGFTSYLWQDHVTQTSTFTARALSSYTVTVVDNNGCSNNKTVVIRSVTGINDFISDKLVVYPNPAKERVYINLKSGLHEKVLVELITTDGKVMIRKQWEGDGNYLDYLDLGSITSGVYYIRISQKNNISLNKLIIEK